MITDPPPSSRATTNDVEDVIDLLSIANIKNSPTVGEKLAPCAIAEKSP